MCSSKVVDAPQINRWLDEIKYDRIRLIWQKKVKNLTTTELMNLDQRLFAPIDLPLILCWTTDTATLSEG